MIVLSVTRPVCFLLTAKDDTWELVWDGLIIRDIIDP